MPSPAATSARRRRVVFTAVCATAIAASVAAYWNVSSETARARGVAAPPRAAGRVSIATATRQDVPIYLTGLGTVQALYTVAIHSQVDGKLQEVLFTEGQHVKKGDVLAKIDPRLFRAAL